MPRSVIDTTALATASMLSVQSYLANAVAKTGVAVATSIAGVIRPDGLHYPKQRTQSTVQISGTFVATCQVEGSQDNANFLALTPTASPNGTASAAAITTPGVFVFVGAYKSLRLNVTAYTSGAVTALVTSERP